MSVRTILSAYTQYLLDSGAINENLPSYVGFSELIDGFIKATTDRQIKEELETWDKKTLIESMINEMTETHKNQFLENNDLNITEYFS